VRRKNYYGAVATPWGARVRKCWKLWLGCMALCGLAVAGCGSNSSTTSSAAVSVTLNLATVTLPVNATEEFAASVVNATNTNVTWQVNTITGGNATVGTIDVNGNYTAPATVPNPDTVTVTAISVQDTTKSASATVTIDSGIRVTVTPAVASMGTGETLTFVATLTGTNNDAVTWQVDSANGGNSTDGLISANGSYTAPSVAPGSATVTITAVSVADPNQTGTATVTLTTVLDPTFTSIYPTHVGEGALFVDVYLEGTDFLSTTQVLANGSALPVTWLSGNVLRARVAALRLSMGPGTLQFQVERQGGAPVNCTTSPCQLSIDAVRPALVAASPNSAPQEPSGGAAVAFNVDGGYFGISTASPAVTAQFDGQTVSSSATPRQLSVTLSSQNLTQPGLHQVAVVNPSVTTPAAAPANEAVTNFAVQPALGTTPPTILEQSLPLSGASGPIAVAINTVTGIAVVVNQTSNNISLVDMTQTPPALVAGGPIPVGNNPTSVAVDNLRNIALVTNNTDNTLSVVNLSSRAVTMVSTNIQALPYAVGVNPETGMALVAYQSTNIGTLVDVTQNPPAVVGAVSVPTGKNPHIAVEARLNWAFVTPGGAGVLSIVDLSRRQQATITATGGAARVSSTSIVTITTNTPVTLVTGDAVLITGVGDASMDGIFTVTSVPTANSFTFTQAGANSTSGGGNIFYSEPLAVSAVGLDVSGISVNPETNTALLTDLTTTTPYLMSVLDQSIVTIPPLEIGAVASAMNQYTNIGVIINPATGFASFIDPVTPTRLTTLALPGTNPQAVAIDPGTNLALVANQGSNDLTVISMGAIKPLELGDIVLPSARQISPDSTLSSSTDLPITLIGKGFTSGSVARIDGVSLAPISVSDRQMSVSVPASLLGLPRRFSIDVDSGGVISNAEGFSVVQYVDLTGTSCTNPVPGAVAVDDLLNVALVTETACNTVAEVNLNTGAVINTLAVGSDPQGIAVEPLTNTLVVSNSGDNTASIFNGYSSSPTPTVVSVGGQPLGVAINIGDDSTYVANFNLNSNDVSEFTANATATPSTTSVGSGPYAIAIDPYDLVVLVANATSNNMTLLDVSTPSTPIVLTTVSGPEQPTSAVYDPVAGMFIVSSEDTNSIFFVNPTTFQATSARVGINPAAIAYNELTSTLVSANTASATITVLDIQTQRVSANMGVPGSYLVSVAIHKERNLAVIVDQANNRLLLVPLPK
jgi:DNA-binding beta-propeller fold protein YncE